MENSTFFLAYISILAASVAITLAVISFLRSGIKKFFGYLSPDQEVSGFLTRLTVAVLLLGGLSGALAAHYNTGENANWLTLAWDSAGQIRESLQQLFITLIILAVTFSLLLILAKRISRE
jgi:hypothetical protein